MIYKGLWGFLLGKEAMSQRGGGYKGVFLYGPFSAIARSPKAEKISQNTKGAANNYVNQKAKKARKSTGKHLKMTKKEPICLHKTERLAAALKYCELSSGKDSDKTRYVGIWHAVYTNKRATLPQGD